MPYLKASGRLPPIWQMFAYRLYQMPWWLCEHFFASLNSQVLTICHHRHNTSRLFQCELCRAEFTARDSLLRHELTRHYSDICPKYNCPEPNCERHSRPFLRVDSLIRHQRTFLHFEDSPQLGTLDSQCHELSGGSPNNNQVQDLGPPMQPGPPVQLHQRSLPDQREYLHGIQREVQTRCNDIRSQLHQLGSELMLCIQTGHCITERISEIDELEELENRRNFPRKRIKFS